MTDQQQSIITSFTIYEQDKILLERVAERLNTRSLSAALRYVIGQWALLAGYNDWPHYYTEESS